MGKKIIVGCDGTWLNSDDGFDQKSYAPWADDDKGTKATPSNITRICRALEPRPPNAPDKAGQTESGFLQIVNYEPGIGSANNWWDHFINGATAMSIGANVCSGYRAIVEKWEEGDEIFLFGFSRGAFIARSIAAMIRFTGLLTKRGMEHFYDVFQDWENQNIPDHEQHLYPGKRFDDETDTEWCSYARQLQADGLTRLNVPIKAIGVFDTVGSLGVPTVGFRKPTRSYAFIHTQVLSNVSYCFQALALDEERVPFSPTLWEEGDSQLPFAGNARSCTLRQCWFPGKHSNIGGSVADAEIPNITLAWMVQQFSNHKLLDFDVEYLSFLRQVNVEYYRKHGLPERQWAMGLMKDPMTGIQRLGGAKPRTPGRYYRTDPETGGAKNERLENTNEVVHPSVRIRRFLRVCGRGTDDVGRYKPAALKGFVLQNEGEAEVGDPMSTGWRWVLRDPVTGHGVELEEETLGEIELSLLEMEGMAAA